MVFGRSLLPADLRDDSWSGGRAGGAVNAAVREDCAAVFIRFPLDNQQLHRIKANFMACRYAGVVGAVDGTHIQIIAPSKDEDVFATSIETKVHSTNTQIVFDATFNILDRLSLQDVLTPLNPQPGAQLKYNILSGFLWTINNYTGSKPTSWHAGMPVWSALLTGRTYK
ncbi:hypothetical protein N1851_033300 [Merluccius polli]|uniref:DDE Tnp4 domain-containing protein n=1 Tax=Merluccius polli TaxID=89951 RepID=A0AA47NNR4_MERPO|nr:hypothetical protein N1851_033300 [Merluccius polli]